MPELKIGKVKEQIESEYVDLLSVLSDIAGSLDTIAWIEEKRAMRDGIINESELRNGKD